MSRAIPIVDLTTADGVDDTALLRGLADFGLVHVRGAGIDPETLDGLYDDYRTFTTRSDIWFQRGWTPPNTERAVVAGGQPDFKECYFAVPIEVDPDCQVEYPQVFADNVWPQNLDSFRARYKAIGARLHTVGLQLLAGIARALKLPSDIFSIRVDGAPHEITAPSQPGYTRCSMAHFIHLHPHQPVSPLPAFSNAEAIRAYGPTVLAGTYGLKTLVDIGLAPASALDRLGFRHYERLAEQRQTEGRE